MTRLSRCRDVNTHLSQADYAAGLLTNDSFLRIARYINPVIAPITAIDMRKDLVTDQSDWVNPPLYAARTEARSYIGVSKQTDSSIICFC